MAPSTTTTNVIPPSTANVANATTQTLVQRKQNAAFLATQYTKTKRAGEIISVSLYGIFLCISLYRLLTTQGIFEPQSLLILAVSNILSMALADLFSGLAHWGADTWGNFDTPVVGKSFIRSFREHHVDPLRITQHDFIETNGDNCMITVPFLGYLAFGATIRTDSMSDIFLVSFFLMLCVWVSLTNQIHKWSHTLKPPKYITLLQEWNIILSRKDHQIHHHTPFDRYYCITNGWLNPILGAIGFWKRMEVAITALTGAIPRQDDAYWTVQFKNLNQEENTEEKEEKN